jgi:hypothetical protein
MYQPKFPLRVMLHHSHTLVFWKTNITSKPTKYVSYEKHNSWKAYHFKTKMMQHMISPITILYHCVFLHWHAQNLNQLCAIHYNINWRYTLCSYFSEFPHDTGFLSTHTKKLVSNTSGVIEIHIWRSNQD